MRHRDRVRERSLDSGAYRLRERLRKNKDYTRAAVFYARGAEEAARFSKHYANRQVGCLLDRQQAFLKAEKYQEALDALLAALKATPERPRTVRANFRWFGEQLLRKKAYGVVSNYLASVTALDDVSSDIVMATKRTWMLMLDAQGEKTAARAYCLGMLDDGASIVNTLGDLRKTYTGREEREGFKVVEKEFRARGKDLTDKEKKRFWNDFGYDAYLALYYDGMKLATEELKKLGEPGVTKYGSRVDRSMEAFEGIASFPKKESEIRFPKSIADFGVKMTNGTVHVAKEFGFNEKDATENLQKALDSGASRIIVENTGKPWIIRMVYPRANTEIIFQKGVRFIAEREWFKSRKHRDAMFMLKNVQNVMIRGENDNDHEVVVSGYRDFMDRARTCRDYGASAFVIDDCENIAIMNMRVHDTGMDGICLGGLGPSNKDTYLKNLDLDSHFRQACSICAAHGAYFKNVRFRNTAGAEPAAGVDLEPAEMNQSNWALYFFDCTFEGNMGGGLLFSTSGYEPIGVSAKRCTFEPQRKGNLMVFIRQGLYAGRNITVPGKAVFEDCAFRSFSDVSPISVEGLSLIDLVFKNCSVTDVGKVMTRGAKPDASAVSFWLNNDVWSSFGIPDDNRKATISFGNVTVTGYTNAPPIAFRDDAGHYSVRNIKGEITFNGKKIDAGKFNYDAPDFQFEELPQTVPTGLAAPTAAATGKTIAHPFTFRYDGHWWQFPPDYTYLFHGKKGGSAEFLLRYAGWVPGDKKIRVTAPSGKVLELGEFKVGDNRVRMTFPEDGWYAFHPAARHVLVDYKGVNLCYYAGTSRDRKIQIDAPHGYTGYFEVPAKKDVTLKVCSGALEIRDAQGALVTTLQSSERTGAAYATVKSASGKPEVWSFAVPEKTVFKFFKPANGVWADSPEAVPVAAKDAVRSPVVKIARAAKTDAAEDARGVPLASYLKAHPALAKIVEKEVEKCLNWAKKGEYSKVHAERKAWVEKTRKRPDLNEQMQREISDVTRGLAATAEQAATEAWLLKATSDQLTKYAFANAFVVLYGIYPNADIGGRYIRSLHDRTELAAADPEVYWWIYKADYENYIRNIIAEMKLGYRDFTLVCDDDKKLGKLLPVLQKFVSASLPEDLKNK